MNLNETHSKMEDSIKASKAAAFQRWMTDPTTKMLISMLGPSEHTEGVLRAAFEHGFDAGSSAVTIEFLKVMMRPR